MKRLLLWKDAKPRHAAESMAWDHALLLGAILPVLRVYRWAEPCCSCGYFANTEEVKRVCNDLPWVRRWTGGGVVFHGKDWAYTLVIPRTEPAAQRPAAEFYEWIHSQLCAALACCTPSAATEFRLEATAARGRPQADTLCFRNPVRHDVIWNGNKVGGAGQRRTRNGLLHQGSLQLPQKLHPTAERVAEALGEHWEPFAPSPLLQAQAQILLENRYATPEWNHMR